MKLKLALFYLLIFQSWSIVFAQAPPFNWAKSFSGNNHTFIHEMVIDSNQNVIIAGSFKDSISISTGSGNITFISNGQYDIFILKLDSSGNFIWGKHYGGTGLDVAKAIKIDSHNNLIIGGYFNSFIDFNPGTGVDTLSAGSSSAFILKLSNSGNFIWAKRTCNSVYAWSYGEDLVVDSDGNIYNCGKFAGSQDFDPGSGVFLMDATQVSSSGGNSSSAADYYLQKLDSNGSFKWAISGEGTVPNTPGYSSRSAKSITLDQYNNVYLLGEFFKLCDFKSGPGSATLTSNGSSDSFILKVDSSGTFHWAKSLGSSNTDYSREIKADQIGNIYVAVIFQDTIDLGLGSGTNIKISNGFFDIALLKLDTSGSVIWSETIGSNQLDDISGLDIDQYGYVYSLGVFTGTVNFSAGGGYFLTSNNPNSPEFYLQKLNSNGGLEWADNLDPQSGILNPSSIALGNSGEIYCSGHFTSTIDVDMGAGQSIYVSSSSNYVDAICFKLRDCLTTTDTLFVNACDTFISPSGFYLWTASGTYNDTIVNSAGCDSLLVINLTIGTIDSLFITSCDSFLSPSTSVYWDSTGVYIDSMLSVLGCDSILIYDLNIIHSSFDTFSIVACGSFSPPSGTTAWTSSGVYNDTIANTLGCDSINTYFLTVNPIGFDSVNLTVCDSFTSPSSNYTWSSSGYYYDTIPTTLGCDSIIRFNLTVNYSSNTVIDTTVCDFYISDYDTSIWTSSGTYFEPYFSSLGCDSNRTINLTIISIDTSISAIFDSTITPDSLVLWSNASGSFTYQWLNCDSNSTPIVGATNQYYVPQNSGNYSVVVSSSSCSKTSYCFNISGLSVTNLFENNQINIYPNPTNNLINIRQEKANSITIQVLDITGKVLLTKSSTNQLTTIDLSEFTNGIYLVKVSGGGDVRVEKVIKE